MEAVGLVEGDVEGTAQTLGRKPEHDRPAEFTADAARDEARRSGDGAELVNEEVSDQGAEGMGADRSAKRRMEGFEPGAEPRRSGAATSIS